jgi:hypothetical protein
MSYIMMVSFIGEGEQEYPEKTTEVTSRIRNSSQYKIKLGKMQDINQMTIECVFNGNALNFSFL